MRHEAACIGILGLTSLLIYTVQLNIESRQMGYRIGSNITESDNLRQLILSRRESCRQMLEMKDVQNYVKQLGLTVDELLPPVLPEENYDKVVAYGGPVRDRHALDAISARSN